MILDWGLHLGDPSSFNFPCRGRSIHVCSEDAYAASLWGGSIGGMVVGILVIVLMSLPLCCGVLKQYGKAGKISLVGGTVGVTWF